MKNPMLNEVATSEVTTDVFIGLDRNLKIAEGAMQDMENMTADYYPLLSCRDRRTLGQVLVKPNGLLAKEKLAWVSNRNLYYGAQDLTDYLLDAGVHLTDSPKQLVSMGAYIIILPDKAYISTVNPQECGPIEADWTVPAEQEAAVSICMADGGNCDYTPSATPPDSPQTGQFWLDTSGTSDQMKVYGNTGWTGVETVYCRIDCPGIGEQFRENDAVTLTGAGDLDGSKILYGVTQDSVILIGSVRQRTVYPAGSLRLRRTMPDLDFCIECGNRLWGCKYGIADGKTVNELYCCALGDFKNWNRFAGVSTDSWVGSVGTDGPWTGAINYLGNPLFFKEEHLHKIYVSGSGAHEVVDTACRGVQKGCAGSLCVVQEQLYYKSRDGICVYDGSLPSSVSYSLGQERYGGAVGGSIGSKYYLSMGNDRGWNLFCYDVSRRCWTREDSLHAEAMVRLEDELYLLDRDSRQLIGLTGRGQGEREGRVRWSCATGIIGYADPRHKYVSRFCIRLKLEDGASVQVSVEYDSDGRWLPCGSIVGNGLRSSLLPVRPRRCDHFRIRMTGLGEAKIYSISKVYERGSDVCGR